MRKIKGQAPLETPIKLPAKPKFLTGQVSLELGAAFICIFIILFASIKICTWVVGRMVVRQEDYEASRNSATIGVEVDESDTARYKKLDLFR